MATEIDPETLWIDEILDVGDQPFRQKCSHAFMFTAAGMKLPTGAVETPHRTRAIGSRRSQSWPIWKHPGPPKRRFLWGAYGSMRHRCGVFGSATKKAPEGEPFADNASLIGHGNLTLGYHKIDELMMRNMLND